MKKIFDIGNGKNNPWGTYAQAIDDNFTELSDNVNKKQDKLTISQTTGQSTKAVMSQKAVTDALNKKPGKVIDGKGEVFNSLNYNSAEGVNAHAEGFGNAANGEASHVEGIGNTADGVVAHVEGRGNTASSNTSHVEGKENKGSGDPCHAEGYQTEASGAASHTEGKLTKASGSYAHAEGEGTVAQNTAEHACGRYNVSGGGVTQWSVGIGTSDDDRKNAAEIRTDGKMYLMGLGGYDGKSAYGKKSVQEVLSEAGSGSYIIPLSTPEETEEWAKSVFGDYTGAPENHPVYLAIKNETPLAFINTEAMSSVQYSATCVAAIISSKLIFILNYIIGAKMYVVNISYVNGGTYTVTSKKEVTIDNVPEIVQATGVSETAVMSQNAVTQAINSASVNSLHLKSGVPEETAEWSGYIFSAFAGDASEHPILLLLKEQKPIILYIHESPYNLIPASLSAVLSGSQITFTLSYIFNNILYVVRSIYNTPTASAEWAKSVFGDYQGSYDTHPLYVAVKAGRPIQYSLNGDTNLNIAASVNVSIIRESLSISLEYISSGRYYLVVTTFAGGGNYSVNIVRNIDISSINDVIASLSSRIPTVVQSTGTSTTSVMSQDAVTKAINNREDIQFIDLGDINTEYPSDDIVDTIITTVVKKSEVQEFINNANSKIAYICFMSSIPMIMVIERNFTSTVSQDGKFYCTYRLESTEPEFGTIYSGKFYRAKSSSSFSGSINKINFNLVGSITG